MLKLVICGALTYLTSRGGLTVSSKEVSDFVATGYALLDLFDQHVSNKVRNLSLVALEKYSPLLAVGC